MSWWLSQACWSLDRSQASHSPPKEGTRDEPGYIPLRWFCGASTPWNDTQLYQIFWILDHWWESCHVWLPFCKMRKLPKVERSAARIEDGESSRRKSTTFSLFSYYVVDYFGPFYVKEGRRQVKRYGVLFTCLSSRAVHLEVANSLTANSFINAYRRPMWPSSSEPFRPRNKLQQAL